MSNGEPGIERRAIQDRLDLIYEAFLDELRELNLPSAQHNSAPLFINVPQDWVTSRHRMMVFGRETIDWGLHEMWSPDGRSGVMSLSEALKRKNSIETLKRVYEDFECGLGEQDAQHSVLVRMEDGFPLTTKHFWRAFHYLRLRLEGNENSRSILYSNFSICDLKGGALSLSSRRTPGPFEEALRNVLVRQLETIRPKVAVFMMGSLHWLQFLNAFAPTQFSALIPEEGNRCQIFVAKEPPSHLPSKLAWCAHPRAWRGGAQGKVLERLAKWIVE